MQEHTMFSHVVGPFRSRARRDPSSSPPVERAAAELAHVLVALENVVARDLDLFFGKRSKTISRMTRGTRIRNEMVPTGFVRVRVRRRKVAPLGEVVV